MLEDKTNVELIEGAISSGAPTPMELELAERLQAAIEELDRLTAAVVRPEAHTHGEDA